MTSFNAETTQTQQPPQSKGRDDGHIIVFGNEKGGSGKSTTAMHVAITLLRMGYKVGTIDLDARQGTLTRYVNNRLSFVQKNNTFIPSPDHLAIERSDADAVKAQQSEERGFFGMAISEMRKACDFVIVDTPGTNSYLSSLAHSYADTLITPMNDSFVDLDLLVDIDPGSYEIKGPSIYTTMVEEQKLQKRMRGEGTINWIVMRNRLSHVKAKNKILMEKMLERISHYAEFTLAPGFGERVVFRELFLKGLTLLDIKSAPGKPLTASQRAAREEVRQLIITLAPETLKGLTKPLKRKAQ